MKFTSSCLVVLAIFFTLTISAPLERGHRLFPHRGLSRRVQVALVKQPLNLTFTPTDSLVHVEPDVATQLQTSDFRFSATLFKVGHDDAEYSTGGQDTYGGHHVVISASDLVVWALQQRGVSKDDMPQYVRQNVHVADPNTGDRYQLVPDNNPVSIDSGTIMITLNTN